MLSATVPQSAHNHQPSTWLGKRHGGKLALASDPWRLLWIKIGEDSKEPLFQGSQMLAKLTAKNQLTLPKRVTNELGDVEYFEVETRNGQVVLTPVRIQRADAVRAKLAELDITEETIRDAVVWARSEAHHSD